MAYGLESGFMGGYLGAGQALANTALTRQQTENLKTTGEAQAFNLEQGRINADILAKRRQALMAAATDDLKAQESPPPPGVETPPLSQLYQQEAAKAENRAKELAKVGDAQGYETAKRDALNATEKLRQAQKQEFVERQKTWDKVRNMVGGITDQATLDRGLEAVEQSFPNITPKQAAQYLGAQEDPQNPGKYLFTPQVAENAKKIVQIGATEQERISKALRDDAAKRAEDEAKRREENDKDRRAHEREMEALARANLDERKAITQERNARLQREEARKVGDKEQANLNKDPVYSKWTQYEQAGSFADSLTRQLSTPGGWQQVKASDMDALARQYRMLSEQFRTRTGGQKEMQDMAAFNGLYQKLEKWASTWGRGTPKWSESTAKDVIGTMSSLKEIANEAVVTSSLTALDKTSKRGGDPAAITMKGDLDRLQKIGRAWQETEKVKQGNKEVEKRYLVIGTKGGITKRFEITPDAEE